MHMLTADIRGQNNPFTIIMDFKDNETGALADFLDEEFERLSKLI